MEDLERVMQLETIDKREVSMKLEAQRTRLGVVVDLEALTFNLALNPCHFDKLLLAVVICLTRVEP